MTSLTAKACETCRHGWLPNDDGVCSFCGHDAYRVLNGERHHPEPDNNPFDLLRGNETKWRKAAYASLNSLDSEH